MSVFPEAEKINPQPNIPELERLKVDYSRERNTQIFPPETEGIWGGGSWAFATSDPNDV